MGQDLGPSILKSWMWIRIRSKMYQIRNPDIRGIMIISTTSQSQLEGTVPQLTQKREVPTWRFDGR
jgi:hypothetical protein